jgi:cardiolipin synthase (CMP-forming)
VVEEQVSNRIVTIPNVISFIRLLGVPFFWWVLLVEENVGMAGLFIVLIGWTDWIDGYLARRLNQVTKLGKALDPIADRLMIASAVIGGLIAGVVPAAIGILLIVRELFMGAVALTLAAKGAGTLEVRYLGKVSTFMLYGAIPAFYFAEAGFLEPLMRLLAWAGGLVGLALYWWVAFQYVGDARARLLDVESSAIGEES